VPPRVAGIEEQRIWSSASCQARMPGESRLNKRAGAPPTIIDVAKKAGVSIKTVSRVLNKEATVHPDTRALVLEVVAELNYRPQLSARSLAGAKSFILGLLYYEPSASFVAGVQRGATARCRQGDYHLVVESLQSNGADIKPQIDHMLAALRPDGMILTPPICDNPDVLATLRAAHTPCVLISPAGDGHGMPRVLMDDVRACEELANLLISLGHTNIAFIRGAAEQSAAERRQAGFERAMAAHGLPVDKSLVYQGRFTFESGVEAAHHLLSRSVRPTAVFASNDDMALGVLAAAQRLGIAVPRDLSIVGFDDSRAATLVFPGLTTVRQPVAELAMAAVDMLLSGELKPGVMTEPPRRVLPHELVVRGSTAAPV
jgi:LacI family transcriptional regulator